MTLDALFLHDPDFVLSVTYKGRKQQWGMYLLWVVQDR